MPDLFRLPYSAISAFTLSELNAAIKAVIEGALSEPVWVVAEISEIRCNLRGHCYLELVEREGEKTLAQIRATIWSRAVRSIADRFESATGESLKQGMKVLLQVNVVFHEVYGLSLNVRDIDPTYSLGEMARKKREIVDRLTKEGLLQLNKEIALPLVPQRIAVVSSATAAGYGDFVNHIEQNPFGFKIFHTLYQSSMQGQDAEASLIAALREIRRYSSRYDAVVIVRGGGSQIDLSCFDSYGLAAEVAKFPLPVITGIGHERDDTVLDLVAHTKLKTPTAVAEFLLSRMSGFESRLQELERSFVNLISESMKKEDHRLQHLLHQFRYIVGKRLSREMNRAETVLHKLIHGSTRTIGSENDKLKYNISRIIGGLNNFFRHQDGRITHYDQAIRLLDPVGVLKRGYSITYFREKALKDSADVHEGDIIRTMVYRGEVTSRVEAPHARE